MILEEKREFSINLSKFKKSILYVDSKLSSGKRGYTIGCQTESNKKVSMLNTRIAESLYVNASNLFESKENYFKYISSADFDIKLSSNINEINIDSRVDAIFLYIISSFSHLNILKDSIHIYDMNLNEKIKRDFLFLMILDILKILIESEYVYDRNIESSEAEYINNFSKSILEKIVNKYNENLDFYESRFNESRNTYSKDITMNFKGKLEYKEKADFLDCIDIFYEFAMLSKEEVDIIADKLLNYFTNPYNTLIDKLKINNDRFFNIAQIALEDYEYNFLMRKLHKELLLVYGTEHIESRDEFYVLKSSIQLDFYKEKYNSLLQKAKKEKTYKREMKIYDKIRAIETLISQISILIINPKIKELYNEILKISGSNLLVIDGLTFTESLI